MRPDGSNYILSYNIKLHIQNMALKEHWIWKNEWINADKDKHERRHLWIPRTIK